MQVKTVAFVAILFVFAAGIMSMSMQPKPKPWAVPDKAKKANPVKSNSESVAAGKALWGQHCASCHGKTGKGDGSKAAQLKTPMEDFTAAAFQGQSDGSIFYKTSEGRDEMPSFKKKIPEAWIYGTS